MGIRGLEPWLNERGLVKTVDLSALSGTRLGIDANHYLQRLLTPSDPSTSDTFVAAVGGAPLALTAQIERDLKTLEKAGVKPVFVFNGIAPQTRERPFLADEPKSWRRQQAWALYETAKVAEAQAEFGASQPILPADVVRVVHRLFKQRSVEFVVAPYLAWAQLVYLERHERAYIHSIWGANELFLFEGIDKIILEVNLNQGKIKFASKNQILREMSISSEQFLDLGILAGFEASPTFPAIDPREFQLRSVIDLIKSRGTGVASVLAFKDFPPVYQTNFIEQFARSRCMIKFSLVLVAQQGRVLPLPLVLPPPPPITPNQPPAAPLTAADVPTDISEIFSPHLPDEVFYQLFRGLISPPVLTPLATGHVIEGTPLCGGSPEYERYVKNLTENPAGARCVSIGLLASVLHPNWNLKPCLANYYFDAPGREFIIPHTSAATLSLIESVSKWNVDARYVENELRRQSSSTIDLSLCLGATSSPSLAQRTIVPKNSERLLEKKDEIVANTLWRFLELRSFLTPSHGHSPHAHAIYSAMKISKVNDKFQESLFLAIELLRAGALHSGKIGTRPYSGGPNFSGSDQDKRSMLLVMRVLSIVPLSFNPGPWSGPLSRELLVFNSFLRVTSRSMRNLLEAVLLNLLLRSDARRSREDYLDITLSLPFQTDTNTGMGILFKAYGDAVCMVSGGVDVVIRAAGPSGVPEEQSAVKEAKDQVLELLSDAFPNVKNVGKELERGFRFWAIVMVAVRSLKSHTPVPAIAPELAAQFEAADAWLKPFGLI